MSRSDQVPTNSGFTGRSTGDEVLAGIDLTGRTAIVTGGYSGLGLETTRALARAGARVVVAVRTPEKAADSLADVEGQVETAPLDLSELPSVRAFADQLVQRLDRLDLLINNAGIMACPLARVGPGWESQFRVNHMGHFALTQGLLALLRRTDRPRVVCLSSGAHSAATSAGTTSGTTAARTTSGRPTARPRPPTRCSPTPCRAGCATTGAAPSPCTRAASSRPCSATFPPRR